MNKKRLALVPRMVELRKQGCTIREIQAELKLSSPGVVGHYLRQYGGEGFEGKHPYITILERRLKVYRKEIEWHKDKIKEANNLIVDAEAQINELEVEQAHNRAVRREGR